MIYTIVVNNVPPSLNQVGASRSWRVWHGHKRRWQTDLGWLLREAKVPPTTNVQATVSLRFPVARGRDEGNFRALIEKALGDALQDVGVIPDDTPEFYTCGALTFEPSGPKRTVVTLTISEDKP